MHQDRSPTSPAEDESLKEAIRAAWGHDAAPAALRHRVQMAMTRTLLEEPAIPHTARARRLPWDRWPAPLRIATGHAALIALAIGTTWGILNYLDSAPRGVAQYQPDLLTPAPTPTLYALLVTRHESFFAGAADDAPTAATPTPSQIPALRDALAEHLHHPVWVPALTQLGWTLDGLRVSPINGVSAVVASFSRGNDRISAFSLPIRTGDGCLIDAAPPPPDLDQLVDNRSVSSFSQDGQLFALVGSRDAGPYPQADLRALANRFRTDPACMSGCSAAPAAPSTAP